MGKRSAEKRDKFLPHPHQEEIANESMSQWWKRLRSLESYGLEYVKVLPTFLSFVDQDFARTWKARIPEMIVPRSRGVAEARNELPKLLKEVDQGETFIIRGPKGRETLMIDADVFRSLQEAYFALLGELETRNILEDEEAKKSLDAALESDDYVTFSEADDLDAE